MYGKFGKVYFTKVECKSDPISLGLHCVLRFNVHEYKHFEGMMIVAISSLQEFDLCQSI